MVLKWDKPVMGLTGFRYTFTLPSYLSNILIKILIVFDLGWATSINGTLVVECSSFHSVRANQVSLINFIDSEFQKKRRSRDAARSRRGQQNDEFVELANQLPLPPGLSSQLDRLCIMRLVNSYIKVKNLLHSYVSEGEGFSWLVRLDSWYFQSY